MNPLHPLNKMFSTTRVSNRKRHSLIIMPARPANPMQISININRLIFLVFLGHTNINGQNGISHVNATCDDICCEEDVCLVVTEFFHCLVFLLDCCVDPLTVFVTLGCDCVAG